jgi:hypothetical protein
MAYFDANKQKQRIIYPEPRHTQLGHLTKNGMRPFNAGSDEVPVLAICGHVEETGNPAHAPRVMVPCERNIPEPSRYSLLHLGKGEMLDHIIASRGLLQFFRHAEIHNEALPDESGAFRTDTKFPESDHAPVVAEFDFG